MEPTHKATLTVHVYEWDDEAGGFTGSINWATMDTDLSSDAVFFALARALAHFACVPAKTGSIAPDDIPAVIDEIGAIAIHNAKRFAFNALKGVVLT